MISNLIMRAEVGRLPLPCDVDMDFTRETKGIGNHVSPSHVIVVKNKVEVSNTYTYDPSIGHRTDDFDNRSRQCLIDVFYGDIINGLYKLAQDCQHKSRKELVESVFRLIAACNGEEGEDE